MMRMTRSIVTQNSKCEGCAHYDGNAAMKGGACDVGSQPFSCGDGREPQFGYAPLSELSPDNLDDIAIPVHAGQPGAMNEHGLVEAPITMEVVCLGDEIASAAHSIHGAMTDIHKGGFAEEQGQTNRFAPAGHMDPITRGDTPTLAVIAKAIYQEHMSPRQRFKFSMREVLKHLSDKGFTVTEADYAAVGE